jgi:aryl-alcohol dehydrogenase-like predicted oxidoreductase
MPPAIDHARLGRSGLRLSRLCLGTMVLGRRGNADHPRGGAQRLRVVEALARLADELGVPLARYALAWTLRHPAVTSAIVGVRVMRHLDDALRALDVRIPEEHLARIDAPVAPGTNV